MGSSNDLTYLAQKLRDEGYLVLQSKANELQHSLLGIADGAKKLKEEVLTVQSKNPKLERISLIGNSLGGLFARYAVMLLFDETSNTMHGLIPESFMTIATPHLGVRRYTFFEDYHLPRPPNVLRTVVSSLFLQSGKDLFGTDKASFNQSLVYRLATDNSFLKPLQSFSRLRLYANVHLDFMVPLGTAAILPHKTVEEIRHKHRQHTGIVETLHPNNLHISSSESMWDDKEQVCANGDKEEEVAYRHMISSLNRLPWEKVLVRFSGTLPNAHNKICAMTKFGKPIDQVLGYDEGQYVIDHAVEWITAKQ
eukprot:gene4005-4284_t